MPTEYFPRLPRLWFGHLVSPGFFSYYLLLTLEHRVIEMARKYPHASVIGIDLAPPPVDTSQLPSNLRFEIDDVNHGLMHFHNQFDLVHMRSVSGGIQRFEETMKELEQCLKPGGLVIIVDGDGTIYSEDRLHPAKLPSGDWHSDSDREGSWFRKVVLGEIHLYMCLRP